MKIKYKPYEAVLVHKKGNRTAFACSFAAEAIRKFEASPTAVKMILFKSTHNGTRLKKFADYVK